MSLPSAPYDLLDRIGGEVYVVTVPDRHLVGVAITLATLREIVARDDGWHARVTVGTMPQDDLLAVGNVLPTIEEATRRAATMLRDQEAALIPATPVEPPPAPVAVEPVVGDPAAPVTPDGAVIF